MINLNAKVTADGQVDILHAYDDALSQISKGALKSEVIDAVFHVLDRRFNRVMQAEVADPDSKLRHMVEWDTTGKNPLDRLWVTALVGNTVTFTFRESRKQVPIDPRLENVISEDHVFREKAKVFEKGSKVNIKPVQMRFLRWYDDRPHKYGTTLGARKDDIANTVTAEESEITKAGGGKFVNEFSNRFAIFWATADAQTSGEVSQVLQGSKYFRGAVASSSHREKTIKDLKKMRGVQRSVFGHGRNSPAVKAQAKEMIAEIQKELKRYGYNGK